MHILLIEDDLDLGAELQRACFDARRCCRQPDADRSDAGVLPRSRQGGEAHLLEPHNDHVSGTTRATHSGLALGARQLESVSDLDRVIEVA